jgi:hypothetical protein
MAKERIIIFVLLAAIVYGFLFMLPQKATENRALQERVDSLTILVLQQAKDVEDSKQETLEVEARLKFKEDFYPTIETKYVYLKSSVMALSADTSIRLLSARLLSVPISSR